MKTDAVLTSVFEHRYALARALNMVNVRAAKMSSRHARDSALGACPREDTTCSLNGTCVRARK